MRIPLIFSLLFVVTAFSFGQTKQDKKNIKIRVLFESNSRSTRENMHLVKFQGHLRKWVSQNYSSARNGMILVKISAEATNEKTIEGMETMIVADVVLKVLIDNSIVGEEKVWEKVMKSKGSSLGRLKSSAINKLFKSPAKEELISFLDSYLADEFFKNCNKYYDIATKKYDAGEYVEAIKVLSYIHKGTTCVEKAKNLMNEAFLMEQKKVCSDHVYKATIAYESGDYSNSIKHLYKISPRSKCAKDAMALAQKIGKKFKKSGSVSEETVTVHRFIIEHAEQVKQAEWDEKIMLDFIKQ